VQEICRKGLFFAEMAMRQKTNFGRERRCRRFKRLVNSARKECSGVRSTASAEHQGAHQSADQWANQTLQMYELALEARMDKALA
jgi:hypothetical protein